MIAPKIFTINAFDFVIKNSIYILVFLMPIFFLPWSFDKLDFNKQALLIFLIFISFFSWMLKVIVSSKLNLRIQPFKFKEFRISHITTQLFQGINKAYFAIGILLLANLLSTIFSVSRYGSFWGWPQITYASLISVICFCILYFLVVNNFSEKEIFTSFKLLAISVCVVQIYGIFQLVGFHLIPLSFTQNNVFNTVGSVGIFGLFVSMLLPMFIIGSVIFEKWEKIIFVLNTLLTFVILLLINYSFTWLITLVGSLLVVSFWFFRRDILNGRWIFLPIFFLVISAFFVTFSPQLKWLPVKNLEVSLSNKASLGIVSKTLQVNPVLGSGPGTFIYDFAKYKIKDFNKGSLWNVEFNAGSSRVLTDLATVGILGLLAWFLFALIPVFYGLKLFIFSRSEKVITTAQKIIDQKEPQKLMLVLGIFIVLIAQTLGYFFYNANISLDFIFFFCLAALTALVFKDSRTYILSSTSLTTLIVTSFFTVILIFGSGILILEGQRYISNGYYFKALQAFDENKKSEAIKYLKIAISSNKKLDFYYRQLAIFSLSLLQSEVPDPKNDTFEDIEKNNIKTLVLDSLGAVNMAISLGPNNVDNWSTKGYVCQNLVGINSDAVSCSIQSYDRALALYPANPYLFFQEGNVYLIEANGLNQAGSQVKNDILLKAKEKFNKAIELKEDYALAYFKLALVEKSLKNTKDFLSTLQKAVKYSPNDAGLALRIGMIYYQDAEWQRAQVEFQRALSIIPNYENAMYYLALTYNNQGQKERAISLLSQLSLINPQNQDIKKIIDNIKNDKPVLEGLGSGILPPNASAPLPPDELIPKK